MVVRTNIFLDEKNIRNIITEHLKRKGYKQIGELEINVRSLKDVPEGAIPGDCIGINAKVEKK